MNAALIKRVAPPEARRHPLHFLKVSLFKGPKQHARQQASPARAARARQKTSRSKADLDKRRKLGFDFRPEEQISARSMGSAAGPTGHKSGFGGSAPSRFDPPEVAASVAALRDDPVLDQTVDSFLGPLTCVIATLHTLGVPTPPSDRRRYRRATSGDSPPASNNTKPFRSSESSGAHRAGHRFCSCLFYCPFCCLIVWF